MISSWLTDLEFPKLLNNTNLVLIPKSGNSETMSELRPIALCNVLYRILSKVLVNRLKQVLPRLISKAQSAFVAGRSIMDNVIVAFEMIHYMKRKSKGKDGTVALKVDMSKAYDRIDWGYLKNIMLKMGFAPRWVEMMMLCVSSVSYNVLVNGEIVGPIQPRRGLRQGDPLSSYLFIICAEGLSSLIEKAEARGAIHGVKICRGAPTVSYLLFTDDSYFFFRDSSHECMVMRDILQTYERGSGQAINLSKSGIFYSTNISVSRRAEIEAM